MSKSPEYTHVTFIKTTPDVLWQALTDGAVTRRYYFEGTVKSAWKAGSRYEFTGPKGELQIEGEVVAADAPRKLVTTFSAVWDEDVRKDRASRATFEIEPMGDVCKLAVTHDDSEGETATYQQAAGGGWAMIVSSLKSLLETGQALSVTQPQSAAV